MRLRRKLIIALIAVPSLSWILLGYLLASHPAFFPATLQNAKSTLLVVAHPDDECLFFSPSVLWAVRRAKSPTSILVLSSGNHYGLGDERRQELKGSCEELGVPSDRCQVLNVPIIQDDPHKWWPVQEIIRIVKQHVALWDVDVIITFDAGGVSGHINHRAVSAALTQYALEPDTKTAVYLSQTVNLLRKYSGLIDLPISTISFLPNLIFGRWGEDHVSFNGEKQESALQPMVPPYTAETEKDKEESEERRRQRGGGERALLVGDLSMYFAARRAFGRHQSQLSWDRYIYMIICRYMYFNTLERVV